MYKKELSQNQVGEEKGPSSAWAVNSFSQNVSVDLTIRP